MCWHREHLFAADGSAPGRARRAVALDLSQTLTTSTSPVIHDAELVVSELLTNSLNAHARQARLLVDIHYDHVLLRVDDDGTGTPRPRTADKSDENGRGLAIVAAISRSWGHQDTQPGTRVWAELALDDGLTHGLDCTC